MTPNVNSGQKPSRRRQRQASSQSADNGFVDYQLSECSARLPSLLITKLAQIQEAIRQLPPAEQQELRHRLLEEESPEMLAAADEGLRSLV